MPDAASAAHRHAFLYTNGALANLGTLNGGTQSFAYALNDAAQVVGASNGSGAAPLHAVLFNAGTVTDLNPVLASSTTSNAYAINAGGDFAGAFRDSTTSFHAYRRLAASGIVTDLGTFGGTTSQAYGINASGDVTGFAHTPSQDAHAFRYGNAGLVDLGTLGGSTSVGRSIGPSGHVVGDAICRAMPDRMRSCTMAPESRTWGRWAAMSVRPSRSMPRTPSSANPRMRRAPCMHSSTPADRWRTSMTSRQA